MPFRPGFIGAVLLAVSLAVAAPASAANQTVTTTSTPNTFVPAAVTVFQGETVTWNNTSGGNHNVRFDDGTFEMPASPTTGNWTRSRQFDTVGVFTYVCAQHPEMTGSVTVQANDSPGPGPPAPAPPGGNPPGGNPPSGPGAPGPGAGALAVTLKFSDSTPRAGKRVRIFGVVKPARDGRKVQIQKRLKSGKFKTIATARLKSAPGDKSVYALRLRVSADSVLRARVAGDSEAATGLSKGRKLDVHRPA
jgi:plastocyanin